MKAKTYLEIGVSHGRIITKVKCKTKIGIDPKFKLSEGKRFKKFIGLMKFKTFKMTSDKFFLEYTNNALGNGIDVAYIDGFHTYKQSLKDVENCLKYLNNKGVIIMHDCNPLNYAGAFPAKESKNEVTELARKGELPGWNSCWNGDVWKTIVHLQIKHNDLEVFTLDLDWGIGIISRGNNSGKINYTEKELEYADYTTLENDRVTLLNLMPPKYLYDFLNRKFSES